MRIIIARLLLVLGSIFLGAAVQAQELPYKAGAVLDVTSIRVHDGKFFEYWNFLEKEFRPLMEESKKQGLILSYHVYGAMARTPQDPNLFLVVAYANYAAFDGLEEKTNVVMKKLFDLSPQKADKEAGERGPLRTIIGDQLLQELEFRK